MGNGNKEDIDYQERRNKSKSRFGIHKEIREA